MSCSVISLTPVTFFELVYLSKFDVFDMSRPVSDETYSILILSFLLQFASMTSIAAFAKLRC
jgi:hypothetical protein